jgi:hypothetical protein
MLCSLTQSDSLLILPQFHLLMPFLKVYRRKKTLALARWEQDSSREDYPQWLGQIGQDHGEDEVHLQGHDLAALNVAQVELAHPRRRLYIYYYVINEFINTNQIH